MVRGIGRQMNMFAGILRENIDSRSILKKNVNGTQFYCVTFIDCSVTHIQYKETFCSKCIQTFGICYIV